jgi:hypothetical protein
MNGRKGRGKTTEFGWNSTETWIAAEFSPVDPFI